MEKQFFDEISSYYDEMIDFGAALERRSSQLKNFISGTMQYAADIGCGTGLDSISLYKSGLKIRAFDPSEGMIEQAKENSEKYNAKIKFYISPFHAIPEIFNSSFDIAVSLGNTVANIPPDQLDNSFRRLSGILKEGGRALIQVLNYDLLRDKNERIVNITRKGDTCFVRFYDFLESHINFNIIRFDVNNTKERRFDTTRLFPHSKNELVKALEQNAFRNLEVFGSLNKDEFREDASGDVVISAYK